MLHDGEVWSTIIQNGFHDSRRHGTMDKESVPLTNNETLDQVSLPLEITEKSTFLHGKLEEEI